MAKAACQNVSDSEARKSGERNGLDTRVFHSVNDVGYVLAGPRARPVQKGNH